MSGAAVQDDLQCYFDIVYLALPISIHYRSKRKILPVIAVANMIYSSFTFFELNTRAMVTNAIQAVGISFIVRRVMTTTAPASAPTTVAVIPVTKAFKPGFFP